MIETAKVGKGDDMQQMTAGRIQTRVGCGKASAFIHGAPTLSAVLYSAPREAFYKEGIGKAPMSQQAGQTVKKSCLF